MNPCQNEGQFNATVIAVNGARRKFKDRETTEIKIDFSAKDANGVECGGAIYLDLSPTDYVTGGIKQGKTQLEATTETLLANGVDISGGQFGNAAQLTGRQISVYGQRNTKGYLNFYLNSGGVEEEKISLDQMQSLMGTPPAQPAQQQQGLIPVEPAPGQQPPQGGNPSPQGGNPFTSTNPF